MTAIEAQRLERLTKLPPNRVAEVVDFVNFPSAREERAAMVQQLFAGLATQDTLQLPPVPEIEAEIQAMRADRHSPQGA